MAGNELKRAGNGMEELHAGMLGPLAASLKWNVASSTHHWPCCPQKIQECCICQIINRVGKSVGQKGYELETSKFLFLSSFCSASKNSLFNICKDIKSTQDGMLDFEFIDSNFTA